MFSPVPDSPEQVKSSLEQLVPKDLLKTYRWGFNFKAELPYGYCVLKAKKNWTTARTIVSYRASAMSPLTTAFAILMRDVAQSVWPNSLSLLKTPQMWRSLHQFLESLPIDQEFFC